MSPMEPSHENPGHDSVDDPTLQAAAAGDRRALRDIYDATSDRVYRLMVRMVGRQDADDPTQQVPTTQATEACGTPGQLHA